MNPTDEHLEGALALLKASLVICKNPTVGTPPEVIGWLKHFVFKTPPSVLARVVSMGLDLPLPSDLRAPESDEPDTRETDEA